MGRGPCGIERVVRAMAGSVIAGALLAGAAHATPWAKLAPAPLASDSAYGALAARPSDSLSAAERAWVGMQREWRAQREEEPAQSSGSITEFHAHRERPSDERFAALASRPYAALADSERAWLVAENAAQRKDARTPHVGSASRATSIIAIVPLAAAFALILAVGIAFSQMHVP